MKTAVVSILCLTLAASTSFAQAPTESARSPQYAKVQDELQKGWNSWDTNTVAGEVLLPDGLEIRLGLKQSNTEGSSGFLSDALIGRKGKEDEQVFPGPHAYDGSYSKLRIKWRGYEVQLEAAHAGQDLVMLVTPLSKPRSSSQPLTGIFSVGFVWNRSGTVSKSRDRIVASGKEKTVLVYLTGQDSEDPYVPVTGPYFSSILDGPVAVSTGSARTLAEIQSIVDRERDAYEQKVAAGGKRGAVQDAIESTIAWDTIYEPRGHRVISPVSRIWNFNWGGYVLFDWDTFFAATMAAVGSRNLAYANAMEIINEATPEGFVPNYARAGGWKSSDRSEPPVGAITVLALYQRFHDRWFLEDTFPQLLRWNIWWSEHRDLQGYLVWGSDGENQPANIDDASKGTLRGAILESGLDNSPMYDNASYNPTTHQMEFADVGLMGMYIADCDALAKIADVLGRASAAAALRARAEKYRHSLSTLWDEKSGIYLNKDLHTGEFSHRLSPTNFYPLLAKAPRAEQAERMIKEHLLNPQEFWGDRVIPSIARNDPAFIDQNYWRGRIWGPMNYLVYLGLLNYDDPGIVEARKQLAEKSFGLFVREWTAKGHVHENYSAVGDDSDNVINSDAFYHWGALLGLIEYEEVARDR